MSTEELRNEVINDPSGQGYAGMRDGDVARLIHRGDRLQYEGKPFVTIRDVSNAREGIITTQETTQSGPPSMGPVITVTRTEERPEFSEPPFTDPQDKAE